MRKNRPSRRSGRNPFARVFGGRTKTVSRAPRRRDIERLEDRQLLAADFVADNPYFEQQWNLDANGQQTEFDPSSPTREQTLATTDINVIDAWEQLIAEAVEGAAGVQVGIISGGFDLTHVDLVDAFSSDLGADLIDGDDDPQYTDPTDAAGTAVAGIIGARNNDEGIVGIAYEAELVPIRVVPGATDAAATAQDRALALQINAGILLDLDGDGVIDNEGLIDTDGDGLGDTIAADQVIDVYYVSGEINVAAADFNRDADALEDEVLDAIQEGATTGRATWVDDGDGIFELDEIEALGAIYVVPAGDDSGTAFDIAFDSQGLYQNAQYNELANSRYTIAVGAVPYDGRYEDNATGTVTAFSEMGANVLIVAPSSTNEVDITSNDDLNSGILTTDLTGDDGLNAAPTEFPVFTEDDDYFADTDYTSTYGGTDAAAAETAAVIAQMLAVNPTLSRRDVEQILLMSASTTDQFSETWVTNQLTFYDNIYTTPNYVYYDIDVDGDGEADIENAIFPNSPILSVNASDPGVIDFYYTNENDLTIGGLPYVDVTNSGVVVQTGLTVPDPLFFFTPNLPDNIAAGVDDLIASAGIDDSELLFTNGAGYTVSLGYGQYLEQIGYAHGLLDAGLAVELAAAWGDLDLTKSESVTVTTAIFDTSEDIPIQGAATVNIGDGVPPYLIPGGVSDEAINVDFFNQFTTDLQFTNVEVNDVAIASVITGAPFYNPEGDLDIEDTNLGSYTIPISIDQGVFEDFLSIEWVEVTSAVASGDIDHLRLTLVSPDGTQSELSQFSLDEVNVTLQQPQLTQGTVAPPDEIIGPEVDIPGSEDFFVGGLPVDDAVPAGTPWTWTTNRHYGEVFAVDANTNTTTEADGQWYLMVENFSGTPIELNGLQISFHGEEATGQRIQGVVGVDDNAQGVDLYNIPTEEGGATANNPTPEQLGDGVFNFGRDVEFGEILVDPVPTFDSLGNYYYDGDEQIITVVLDDAGDSVHFDELDGLAYRTVDPETGEEFIYPVISREAYYAYDDSALTAIDPLAPVDHEANNRILEELLVFATDPDNGLDDSSLPVDLTTITYVNPNNRLNDGVFTLENNNNSNYLGAIEAALNGGFFFGYHPTGTIGSFQNYDYSQESFAAGVLVQATQYLVTYNEDGTTNDRVATGQVQSFVTGADGNYYFDVEAAVEPPNPFAYASTIEYEAAYADWLDDVGMAYEYDIAVVGEDDRLFNEDYSPLNVIEFTGDDLIDLYLGFELPNGTQIAQRQEVDSLSEVSYDTSEQAYTVQMFASPSVNTGQTTKITDVNFLLARDLSEVQLNAIGTVVRDIDGDGVQDEIDGGIPGVTVYYDANNNNMFDADEPFSVTDASGAYDLSFDPGTNDTATVRVDETTYPEELVEIAPMTDGEFELVFENFDPGDLVTGDFFLKPTTSFVSGTVWNDENEDGVFDGDETAIDGTALGLDGTNPAYFVYYDADDSGDFSTGDIQTSITAAGTFQIEFDDPGTYIIRLDSTNAAGFQTFPGGEGSYTVTLEAEEVLDTLDFGVKEEFILNDFGDLPDTYGTTFTMDGARHLVTPGLYLGAAPPDRELDGVPTSDAQGDDDNQDYDDEDGVRLVAVDTDTFGNITSFTVGITATGGGGVLNAWIDFDNSGMFEEDEHVLIDVEDLGTGVEILIEIPASDDIVSIDAYASRFRWGPFGLSATGAANAGEVEDHYLIPAFTTPAIITGAVRLDTDNDGDFDNSDAAQAGVVVFIDDDLDGILDADEPFATTAADGSYTIEVPVADDDTPVTVRVLESSLLVDTQFLNPEDGIVATLASPDESTTANFLVAPDPRPVQTITGLVYEDINRDGTQQEPDEAGVANLTVQLLANIDADPELEVIATTTTDSSGAYSFSVADTGAYEIGLVLSESGPYDQTSPVDDDNISVDVTEVGGTVGDVDFGVFDRDTLQRDYGDLAGYVTTEADGGASHLVTSGVYLGATVDADFGDLESFNATADDIDGFGVDDEDGVVLVSTTLTPGGTIVFDVAATGTADSRLNVWIDWDNNGVFDADEQLLIDFELVSGVTTRIERPIPLDMDTDATTLAARFRWGTAGVGPDGSTGAGGVDAVGEVEDYRFATTPAAAGDFDQSGTIDDDDMMVWMTTYGSTTDLRADGNGDGVVNAADYSIWRDAYETAAMMPPSTLIAPPEEETEESSSEAEVEVAEASVSTPISEPVEAVEPVEVAIQEPVTVTVNEPVEQPIVTPAREIFPVSAAPAPTQPAFIESVVVNVGLSDSSSEDQGVEEEDSRVRFFFGGPRRISIADQSLSGDRRSRIFKEEIDAIDDALLEWGKSRWLDDEHDLFGDNSSEEEGEEASEEQFILEEAFAL